MNGVNELNKGRTKEKNVKIFAGSENFRGYQKMALRATLLMKSSDVLS